MSRFWCSLNKAYRQRHEDKCKRDRAGQVTDVLVACDLIADLTLNTW